VEKDKVMAQHKIRIGLAELPESGQMSNEQFGNSFVMTVDDACLAGYHALQLRIRQNAKPGGGVLVIQELETVEA
jgi:hypothetical protein